MKNFNRQQRYHVFDIKGCQDNVPISETTCKRAYSFDTMPEAVQYTNDHLGIWKILDSQSNIPIYIPNVKK